MKTKKVNIPFFLLGIVLLLLVLFIIILPDIIHKSEWMQKKATQITLRQDAVTVSGAGAVAGDNLVTITQGGNYQITGTLEDGQIYVDAGKGQEVVLSLNGVDISNPADAAIYIEEARHTTILLMENTVNRLQSGTAAESAGKQENESGKESGAVLYANDDLSITGTGFLQIVGYINNGIHTKDNLLLENGSVEIKALNHGIKGKESVTVTGGDYMISVGNKGIQSDLTLTVTDGKIQILKSTEGMEANQVTIEGGAISIYSLDDGINANGGAAKKEKKPSEDIVEDMPNLIIKGGEVYVNAFGDGLDSNGNLLVEGGALIIDGPVKNDDGPLDYGYENGGFCRINGGTALAIGSAGMAETFDGLSAQCSFRHIFKKPYAAGSEIVISDVDGNVICRHTAIKEGASVVFSSPELVPGQTYLLKVGEESVEVIQDAVSTISGEKLR